LVNREQYHPGEQLNREVKLRIDSSACYCDKPFVVIRLLNTGHYPNNIGRQIKKELIETTIYIHIMRLLFFLSIIDSTSNSSI